MTDSEQTVDRSQGDSGPGAQARREPSAEAKPSAQGPSAAESEERLSAEEPGAQRARGNGEAGEAAEVEGDLDELLAVAAQRDEYLSLAQRTQADFENYRKRMARESALAQERGVAKVVKELLGALDNLDRALAEAGGGTDGDSREDPLLDGVRLVRSELAAALARVGVESFSPLGQVFDPALHEAMATIEQPPNGVPGGTVAEVYQPGYRLGETIIRPARVIVAA